MASSTISTLRTNLNTQLLARGNLSNVKVFRHLVDASEALVNEDRIWIGGWEADQSHHAMGGSRNEQYTLSGGVAVWRSGNGDETADAAEVRAIALLKEIEDQLRADETVNSAVEHAQVDSYDATEVATAEARGCVIEWKISVLTFI